MDNIDSSNDEFESAEEFASDCDEKSEQSISNKVTGEASIDDPCKIQACEDSDDDSLHEQSYRKRPERSKKFIKNHQRQSTAPKVVNTVIAPKTILKGLAGHVTSNLSKGMSMIQEKSTTISDLIKEKVVENDEQDKFVYDHRSPLEINDEKSPLQSKLNDSILQLSKEFDKLKSEDNNADQCQSTLLDRNEDDSIDSKIVFEEETTKVEAHIPVKVLIDNSAIGNSDESTDIAGSLSNQIKELSNAFDRFKQSSAENGDSLNDIVSSAFEEATARDDPNRTEELILNADLSLELDNSPQENTLNDTVVSEKDDTSLPLDVDNSPERLQNIECSLGLPEKSLNKNGEDLNEYGMDLDTSVSKSLDEWGGWDTEEVESEIIEDAIQSPKENTTNVESVDCIQSEADLSNIIVDENQIESMEETDWSEEQIDNTSTQDGWGDIGDGFTSLVKSTGITSIDRKTSEMTETNDDDMDGWDDWGEEDAEPHGSNPMSVKNPPPPSARDVTKSADQWSGWDSFGKKKEEESRGIGSWGFNRLINSATSNLSAVTQGISTVIETGLGVPNPETMARIRKTEEEVWSEEYKSQEQEATPDVSQFPFQHIVAGVGKIVEVSKVQQIGSRVLSGGLDTLETIGRKTMEVLQEGDPGLKNKKALILNKGQVLSHVLKEARDRAASEEKRLGEISARRRCDFETLFDDFQGLVHLEALEMLSSQCNFRVEQILQDLPTRKAGELRDTMSEIEQLCEIDDDMESFDNFSEALSEAGTPLQTEMPLTKIFEIHEKINSWIDEPATQSLPLRDIYEKAISTIAELTASVTQQFHKAGELLLLKERRKTVQEADCFLQVSSILCNEINILSNRIADMLDKQNHAESAILISNLRVEAANATSYIKQAFSLLVPVLQVGAT